MIYFIVLILYHYLIIVIILILVIIINQKLKMKILVRDLLILGAICIMWVAAILMCTINQWDKAFEAVIAFPGHLLISIGYYAAVNVCYSILFISDCLNEHKELLDVIKEGREFFENKKIKYN